MKDNTAHTQMGAASSSKELRHKVRNKNHAIDVIVVTDQKWTQQAPAGITTNPAAFCASKCCIDKLAIPLKVGIEKNQADHKIRNQTSRLNLM